MERTLNVKGMMCVNCQKHVHDALLAMDGVSAVDVNLEKGTAKVTASREIPWMNLDPSSAKPVTNWLDQADLQTAAQAVAVFLSKGEII